MAKAPTIRWRRVVTAYPCDICMARPGEKCISAAGRWKYEPHASRSALASADGWVDHDAPEPHEPNTSGHARPLRRPEGY